MSYRSMTTREAQFAAIRLASDCDFPPLLVANTTIEAGRESWLRAIHHRPALASTFCEKLEAIRTFRDQQGATVKLEVIDPATGGVRRPTR